MNQLLQKLGVCSTVCTYFLVIIIVLIDAYPNTTMVEQGTTLILVCRVVGVPSTTVLSYQWTCPGGYCDAGAVDPEWAARIQQGNILVVNVHNGTSDNGNYTCTVTAEANSQQVGSASHRVAVTCELSSCTVKSATLYLYLVLSIYSHCPLTISLYAICF